MRQREGERGEGERGREEGGERREERRASRTTQCLLKTSCYMMSNNAPI